MFLRCIPVKLFSVFIFIVSIQHLAFSQQPQFRYPIDGDRIASRGFAKNFINKWCGYHLAVDVGMNKPDTPVFPMSSGVIKFQGIVLGYTVVIEHTLAPGDPAGVAVCSVYYHMKRPNDGGIQLQVGQNVSTTHPIGYISGKWVDHESAPHLHFGIRKGRFQAGKDTRTERWFFPGYTTIYRQGKKQCKANDAIHQEIISDWFEPVSFVNERESQLICSPSPPGLISWWPGDGNATDIIGENSGIVRGSTTFISGEVAQGFHFNGIDQFVEIPDKASQRPSAITVDAWVKFDSLDSLTSLPGLQYIVFKKNTRSGQFEGYTIVKFRDVSIDKFALVISSAGGLQVQARATTAVVTGQFYHVAGTYDGSTAKIFVNGVLEGQTPANFPLDYDTRPLFIGTSGETVFDGKLNGTVDEVDIFNRALSASEVQAIFNAGSLGKCKPSETIIYDHQLGNNYDHLADPADGDSLNIQKFNLQNPEYTPTGYLRSITLRMTVTQEAIDNTTGFQLKATTAAPFDTCFSDQFVSAQGRIAGVPFDFTFTFSGSCPQNFFNFSNGQKMYSWGVGGGNPFGYKLAYNSSDGHFWQIIRAKTVQ